MKKIPLSPCFLSAAMALAVGMSSAYAVDGSWNVDDAGNWSVPGNWFSGTVPGGAGSVVNLTHDITANRTITIDTTPRVVGTLNIGDPSGASNYTLTQSGVGSYLEMNNSGTQAKIVASGGNNTVNGPFRITEAGLLIQNTGGSFSMAIAAVPALVTTLTTTGTAGMVTLDNASISNFSFGSALMGNVSLLVDSTGSGQVQIGNINTNGDFSGGTVIKKAGGRVSIGGNNVFGTGSVTLGGDGSTGAVVLHAVGNGSAGSAERTVSNKLIVSNSGSNTTLGLQTNNGGSSITWTGDIELQRNLTLTRSVSGAPNSYGKITLTGAISGTGGLILAGAGNITQLSGAGAYSGGVTVNAADATLQLGSATALGSGTLTIAAAANFALDTTGSDLTLTTNNAIALNQNLTYSGSNNSHLNLGTGNVTLSAGNKIITTTAGVLTIGGAVIGTSGQNLTKAGSGILALNGTNTYTGETSVNAGTLRGNGSVAGDLWIGGGATLEAGNSIGTFTAAGEAGFLDGSTFQFELNSSAGTFDQLVANGLSLENNNVTFSVADLGTGVWSGPASFVVINNTSGSAVIGTFAGLVEGAAVNIGDNTFLISYLGGTGNDVTLNLIPEPGAWMLTAVGLGFLMLRRRRA